MQQEASALRAQEQRHPGAYENRSKPWPAGVIPPMIHPLQHETEATRLARLLMNDILALLRALDEMRKTNAGMVHVSMTLAHVYPLHERAYELMTRTRRQERVNRALRRAARGNLDKLEAV